MNEFFQTYTDAGQNKIEKIDLFKKQVILY